MQKLKAFLQVVRWPNLLFILLTQVAFYFFIIQNVYSETPQFLRLNVKLFFLLTIASILIAAAGNIINDYFDVNIDRINKPEKMIVGKIITPRSAILWHLVLSFIGVTISFYVSFEMHQRLWWLGFCNLLVVLLLVVYSSTFKKKLLIGNVLIALLTAWVIIVIVLSQFQLNYSQSMLMYEDTIKQNFLKVFRIGMLYASFAFIITLIREVVKDMEDYIGDMKNGCKTMPIVWGFPVSKVFVAVWTIVLVGLLIILQFYVLQYYWYFAILYCLALVIVPLLFSTKVLLAASDKLHFNALSNIYKFIMLTGILSMMFFKIYA
jgi:4-hydroxybenzoate polyprenyltransferase